MHGAKLPENLFAPGPHDAPWKAAALANREIPESGPAVAGEIESLNLIFVVVGAVFIAMLARYLARRGGRRK
ncbi:MAG: hypothetical protein AB7V55_05970 [Oscillospiraceae bacterium]